MENNGNQKDRKPVILIAGIVLFAVLTGYFAWQNQNLQKQLKQCFDSSQAEAKDASIKNDSMITHLNTLASRYDSLSATYTDLDSLFKTEKERITKLEADLKNYKSGSGGMDYNTMKKEYNTLVSRQEDYLKQINMLKEENRLLTLENISVKSDLEVEKDKTASLSMKVDNLNAKVESGATLVVAFIKADGIQVKSGNEVSVTKARKADKLRCCFTIARNTLAPEGYKDFYLRVIDPSGEVIKNDETVGASGEIQIKEGTSVTYTTKASVLYENENVETCVYTFGKKKSYAKGNYKFEVYFENQKLASTSIVLN